MGEITRIGRQDVGNQQQAEQGGGSGARRYNANSLEVRDVVADVFIRVGPYHAVQIIGSDDAVKAIRVSEQGGRLVIEGDGNGSGGSVYTQTGRGNVVMGNNARGNVIITGQVGSVSIGGKSRGNDAKVLVMVPAQRPITLENVIGQTEIGDTDGPLTARVAAGDIQAGCLSAASIQIQGSGDVKIDEVNGPVTATIQGSGDVKIKGGNVGAVVASVMGSGSVKIKGRAQSGALTVMGSGSIYLAHCTQKPSQNVMGSGDIEVGNW